MGWHDLTDNLQYRTFPTIIRPSSLVGCPISNNYQILAGKAEDKTNQGFTHLKNQIFPHLIITIVRLPWFPSICVSTISILVVPHDVVYLIIPLSRYKCINMSWSGSEENNNVPWNRIKMKTVGVSTHQIEPIPFVQVLLLLEDKTLCSMKLLLFLFRVDSFQECQFITSRNLLQWP